MGKRLEQIVCLTKKLDKWCLRVMLLMKMKSDQSRWGTEDGRLYNHPETESFHGLLSYLTLQLESQGKEGCMENQCR